MATISHHTMDYSHGPPVPMTPPNLRTQELKKMAGYYLMRHIGNGEGYDGTPIGVPEHLARYIVLRDLLHEGRRLSSVPSAKTEPLVNLQGTPHPASLDEFIKAAAETAQRPDEIFLLGLYAFPDLAPRLQQRVVADFTLRLAHCWHTSVNLNGSASYVAALERFMDWWAYMIGVNTQGPEESNRRRMLTEMSLGMKLMYAQPDKLARLR